MNNLALVKKMRDTALAELQRARTESAAALAECQRLRARIERLAHARIEKLVSRRRRSEGPTLEPLEGGLSEAESKKTKSGRPSIWRSLEGFLLVKAVDEIRAENERYSVARAIRKAIKTDPVLKDCEHMRRISDRALQARYQQALQYWSPALENSLHKKLEEVREQLTEANEGIHRLCDLVDGLRDLG